MLHCLCTLRDCCFVVAVNSYNPFFLSTSRFVNMPDGKLVGNIIARSVYFVHECADCHVGRH